LKGNQVCSLRVGEKGIPRAGRLKSRRRLGGKGCFSCGCYGGEKGGSYNPLYVSNVQEKADEEGSPAFLGGEDIADAIHKKGERLRVFSHKSQKVGGGGRDSYGLSR